VLFGTVRIIRGAYAHFMFWLLGVLSLVGALARVATSGYTSDNLATLENLETFRDGRRLADVH
jgi:hypothetical protein